ncbi:MAG: hypothetical protein GY753_09945 [Gammaproteobacteria bacterium]|nr:hypothetical protein [Gammaproteobacteria bacterium]
MARKKSRPSGQGITDQLFLESLSRHVRGFKALAFEDQFHLTDLILSSSDKRRQHLRYESGFALPYQELERRFGRGRFKEINDKLRIFDRTDQWWSEEGQGRVYWLDSRIYRTLARYLARTGRRHGRLINENGTLVRKAPRAIAAKAGSGNTAKNETKGGQVTPLTPVNVDNLKAYEKALKRDINLSDPQMDMFVDNTRAIERANKVLAYVQILLRWIMTDVGANKYLLHRYVESRSGRLYAQGAGNLQTGYRVVRHVALQGCFDYDFENCHYSIFYQLAGKADHNLKSIGHYIDNKRLVRETLATQLGVHINAVKICLISMIYGAQESRYWKAAIPKTIGARKARKFDTHPLVIGLRKDLATGRDKLIEAQKVSNRGKITNAMGLTIGAQEDDKKLLAHLLQGIEAKMLEMARLMFTDKIILLQHDGFTTTERVDCEPLLKRIESKLGLKMAMSEELLQTPDHLLPELEVKPKRETPVLSYESAAYGNIFPIPAS